MIDVKEQIKNDYLSGVTPMQLSEKYNTSLNTIKSWVKRYGWAKIKNEGAPSNTSQGAPQKKKHGAQPGNKNAVGHGAPKGNQNARKHGLFSRYLPEDTLELFNAMDDSDPLDLLWDQIKLAYTAIIRAQQIMYVKDKDDKTKSKIEKKTGTTIGQKWEIQYAWDRLKRDNKPEDEEGVEIINDAEKETGTDIRDCDTEVSEDIQQHED